MMPVFWTCNLRAENKKTWRSPGFFISIYNSYSTIETRLDPGNLEFRRYLNQLRSKFHPL